MKLLPAGMGVLFLLGGLVAIVGGWGAYRTDTAIERSGGRAEGHLTGKAFLSSADGDSDFILEYWFLLPDGQRVETRRGVSKGLWSSLEEGDTLDIRYATANPARNFPTGEGVTSLGIVLFVSVLGIIFVLFGVLLVANAFNQKSGPDLEH